MDRAQWSTVVVSLGPGGPTLEGSARLAELWRWLRGEASPQFVFVEPRGGETLLDPKEVNWNQFPIPEALEAAAAQERRRRPTDADAT